MTNINERKEWNCSLVNQVLWAWSKKYWADCLQKGIRFDHKRKIKRRLNSRKIEVETLKTTKITTNHQKAKYTQRHPINTISTKVLRNSQKIRLKTWFSEQSKRSNY